MSLEPFNMSELEFLVDKCSLCWNMTRIEKSLGTTGTPYSVSNIFKWS